MTTVVTDNQYLSEHTVSYQQLKVKADGYSPSYRLRLDIVYLVKFLQFWFGIIVYPVLISYIFFYTKYWLVALLYVIWIYYDRETPHSGGRKIKLFSMSTIISKYMRDYFPVDLVKTADLPADKNYIFATFPHGIFCVHGSINFMHDREKLERLYPGIDLYIATLNSNFYSPITRDYFLSLGMIAVSERSIVSVLTGKPTGGRACMIVVGGAAEALYSDPEEHKLVLKNRKGFVRIALKTGSSLVPIFGFGEDQLYDVVKTGWLARLQQIGYKWTGIAPVLAVGRNFGPFKTMFPRPSPLITVVGKPIHVPKIENPTKEQVDHYHQKFKEQLYDLFEKYKETCDPLGKDAKLSYI